jgi:hypothetical protein
VDHKCEERLVGIWCDRPGGHDTITLELQENGNGSLETVGLPGWKQTCHFKWSVDKAKKEILFSPTGGECENVMFGQPLRFAITRTLGSRPFEILTLDGWRPGGPPLDLGNGTKLESPSGPIQRSYQRPIESLKEV